MVCHVTPPGCYLCFLSLLVSSCLVHLVKVTKRQKTAQLQPGARRTTHDARRTTRATDMTSTPDQTSVSELLDKLTLLSLHLMEEKLQCEVSLESVVENGNFHLAKSRYIMGQNSVSSVQIPTESSSEFSASTVCDREVRDGVVQLQVTENKAEDTVNPIKWFGVLVPQNLHKAQSVFKSALDYAADCANAQVRLSDLLNKIQYLKKLKPSLASE